MSCRRPIRLRPTARSLPSSVCSRSSSTRSARTSTVSAARTGSTRLTASRTPPSSARCSASRRFRETLGPPRAAAPLAASRLDGALARRYSRLRATISSTRRTPLMPPSFPACRRTRTKPSRRCRRPAAGARWSWRRTRRAAASSVAARVDRCRTCWTEHNNGLDDAGGVPRRRPVQTPHRRRFINLGTGGMALRRPPARRRRAGGGGRRRRQPALPAPRSTRTSPTSSEREQLRPWVRSRAERRCDPQPLPRMLRGANDWFSSSSVSTTPVATSACADGASVQGCSTRRSSTTRCFRLCTRASPWNWGRPASFQVRVPGHS